MDFTKAITYNGITFNSPTRQAGGLPTSGFLLDRFRPEPPNLKGYLEDSAIRDGMDAGDVYLSGRRFGLIVTVLGSTAGDFWDKAQDLQAAFSPTLAYNADTASLGFLAFDFYQPTADIATWPTSAYPSGIPMRYYMRPLGSPAYAIDRDRDGGTSGRGMSKTFDVSLLARDPRKFLQTAVSATVTTSTQTASYRGDYPTFPIFTFSLTATGHSAMTLDIVNSSVTARATINLSAQSSGSWTLDLSKRTLESPAGTSMASLLSTSGLNIPLAATISSGTTFVAANMTGMSTPLLTYREAFV